ncbi:MAG: hypothetical protein LKE40_15075 [Spirochaetia bacterium]|nr:hypothetical protein [Spirochaetia bacterium]
MKRKALFLFLVTVASSSVFSAASNKQEIIPVTSDCQEAMDILYVRQGLALPSQTASYSVAELEGMLQKIDTSKMDADQKATYAYVREVLDAHSYAGKGVGFKLNAYLNPEAYLHENTEDFSGRYGDETTLREQWFRGWMQQQPAASVDIGFYAADQLYAQTDFSYGPTWAYKAFGTSNFSMNIPGAFGMALTEVDANIPYHAYTSFGTDYWNVEIGRDRLNWGPGQTGNLLIGDNLKYQNIAKYTVFGKSFKFTFLVSFFPHQMNYKGNEGTNSQYDELEGLEMLLAHKLEWRLFHDKLNLSIAEAIMYADEDGVLDFSVLNPMNVFHSYFMKANCNSIASLNLDFTVGTTNFYFQGVMDEYTVPYVESKSGSYYPDAWGVLFGLRNYQPYGKVTEITSLEGAYTLPYLYLRGKSGEDVQDGYGINFVVATRVFSDGDTDWDFL